MKSLETEKPALVTGAMGSSWRSLTSGTPGSVRVPGLFSFFVNQRDSRLGCSLGKSADGTEQGAVWLIQQFLLLLFRGTLTGNRNPVNLPPESARSCPWGAVTRAQPGWQLPRRKAAVGKGAAGPADTGGLRASNGGSEGGNSAGGCAGRSRGRGASRSCASTRRWGTAPGQLVRRGLPGQGGRGHTGSCPAKGAPVVQREAESWCLAWTRLRGSH